MSESIEFHELANVFPFMTEEEFDGLVKSIRENGQRDLITLFEGKILDGRNRWKACISVGATPRTVEFDGGFDDARKFVIDVNVNRRHLNESQRGMIAAAIATIGHGGDREARYQLGSCLTVPQAAEMLRVGRNTVIRARRVRSRGSPELIQAVENGDVAVSAADPIAILTHDEQRSRLAEMSAPRAPRPTSTTSATVDLARQAQWEMSFSNHASEAIAMEAFWTRLFGDWRQFETSSTLVTLAIQAAEAWKKLADELSSERN